MKTKIIAEYSSSEKGFTLVELLVSIAIAGVLLVIVFSIFNSLNRGMSGENTRVALQQGVRSAVNVMALDLRDAGLDPYNRGCFSLKKAEPGMVSFSSDRNMNGLYDNGETFTYSLEANNDINTLMLKDHDNSGAQPLLSNIEELLFIYFDERGQEIIDPNNNLDEIRTIEIRLAASARYWGGSGNETREYSTLVKCRNLNRL